MSESHSVNRDWNAGHDADPEALGAVSQDDGTNFRVWAPHADAVRVVGSFNDWSAQAHPLSPDGEGHWVGHAPAAGPGDAYRYQIVNGDQTLERIDPQAREVTGAGGNGVIYASSFDWGDDESFQMAPWNELVIYEMHVGTFHDDPGGEPGDFSSAIEKLPYLRDLGITAVEVMPPIEFEGGFSWGYNPAQPFAIESAYGGPDAFKAFVKAAHSHGIAVLLDVVYNHFGPQELGLWRFDGWHEGDWGGIYFYNDGRARTPWGDTRPDYGRDEVRRYIRDNALMWLTEYRVDGLRWDMTLYIRTVEGNVNDPNGGLPDGWSLMQWVNEEVNERMPGHIMIAEDLRGEEWITKDVDAGGAGFDSQWSAEFTHQLRQPIVAAEDEQRRMAAVRDALEQRFEGNALKRVVYVESHDEVANGRARIAHEIWPEHSRHWFVKKRSTLGAALVLTAPGIPMLFQGQEFLEDRWFQDRDPLDWGRAEELDGIVDLYRDLIDLRRNQDGTTRGLSGRHVNVCHVNDETKLVAYHRWEEGGPGDDVVVVANFRNRVTEGYTIGLPRPGRWRLRFDSHDGRYDDGFEGQVSADVEATEEGYHGLPCRGEVGVAPYSAIVLSQDD